MPAALPTDADLASMTRRADADAVQTFASIATARRGIALGRVLSLRAERTRQAVYNLTVDGEHVYFANGVLVSNCDMAMYADAYVWGRSQDADNSPPQYPAGSAGQILGIPQPVAPSIWERRL